MEATSIAGMRAGAGAGAASGAAETDDTRSATAAKADAMNFMLEIDDVRCEMQQSKETKGCTCAVKLQYLHIHRPVYFPLGSGISDRCLVWMFCDLSRIATSG